MIRRNSYEDIKGILEDNNDNWLTVDEKMAKKYNAILRFFKNKNIVYEDGCYNTLVNEIYLRVYNEYIGFMEKKTSIILVVDGRELEFENSKELRIDRKYKSLERLYL